MRKGGNIALYIVLSLVAVVMVGPFIWMVLTSFKFPDEVIRYPPTFWPRQPHLDNYRRIFQMMNMGQYFLNSSLVASIATTTTLFFSALGGYTFAKFRFPGREQIFMAIIGTMMVPFFVIMIPLYVMMVRWQWVDSFKGLLAPGLMSAYGLFLMRQFMSGIPTDLIQASRIDGCSEFGIFTRIILPLSKPALSALGIFTFMWNWDSFLWPLVIVDSERCKTLPIALAMFTGQYFTQYELVMAASTIAVLPVLLVFFTFQRQIIEGITLTGIKG
mgnify:FL=1